MTGSSAVASSANVRAISSTTASQSRAPSPALAWVASPTTPVEE